MANLAFDLFVAERPSNIDWRFRRVDVGYGMPSSPVELLQDLIRIPSVNPDGDPGTDQTGEQEVAEYVAGFLREECGAEVTLEEVLPGRPNVLGRFSPAREEAVNLLLAPHTDTVGIAGMTIDPFGAEIRDGKIWGRGASDTKGSMAAMLWALRQVSSHRSELGVNLMFAGFMGEESAQHGSQHFARNHGEEVNFAIAGEPTELNVVHAHKACWWLDVGVRGKAAHSSKPELGENAVVKMASLITDLDRTLSERLAAFSDEVLGESTHSINQCHGGVRANVVPDECRLIVDFRATPGLYDHGVERLLRESLESIGHGDASVRVVGESPTLKTDPDHLAIRKLQELGSDLTTAPWFCDAGWLAQAGIPSIALGPGSIDQAHTKDEWIQVADLEEGARFLERFLRSF